MEQTGKALSTSLSEASPMALGELSPDIMPSPASEAGGEHQEERLPIISTLSASSSPGEGRLRKLGRRIAELSTGASAVEAAQAGKALSSPAGGRSRRAFGEVSPGRMAALASEAGGEPQEEVAECLLGNLGRTLAGISIGACAVEAAQAGKALSCPAGGRFRRAFGDLPPGLEAALASEAGGEHQEVEVTTAIFKDENAIFDLNILKNTEKRHFLETSLNSEETQGPSRMPSLNAGAHLNDLVNKGINIRGKEFRNKWFASDDESSSASTVYSDIEDEVLNLLTVIRQPNYQHMPAEEFALPELSSLDLLQLASNQEMGGITIYSSSSSSSSSSTDDLTRLDDHDCIYSERESIGIAADEEEEFLLAEASVCVAEDLEAIEIIINHDKEEVLANLGIIHPVRTHGVERETLLDLRIIFFGKEKNASSCSVCINDFGTTDRCIRLPCKHLYHFNCIIRWLLTKNTCPVCRTPLSDQHVNRAGGGSL